MTRTSKVSDSCRLPSILCDSRLSGLYGLLFYIVRLPEKLVPLPAILPALSLVRVHPISAAFPYEAHHSENQSAVDNGCSVWHESMLSSPILRISYRITLPSNCLTDSWTDLSFGMSFHLNS